MRKDLLNQPIDAYSFDELELIIKSAFANSNQLKIVTLNPEMIVNARKNFEFQAAINNANVIIPDGTGITWAFKVLKNEKVKRLPGIELTEKILEIADSSNLRVAIFGGSKEILNKVVGLFKNLYPNLKIVRHCDGYQGIEQDQQIAKEIANEFPDLILVAVGSPRQEIWINKYSSLFPKSIMIGIGGSLDIWSGKVMRAPLWIREKGFEWLYRVITQPKRTTRILRSLPKFIWLVFKTKFSHQIK